MPPLFRNEKKTDRQVSRIPCTIAGIWPSGLSHQGIRLHRQIFTKEHLIPAKQSTEVTIIQAENHDINFVISPKTKSKFLFTSSEFTPFTGNGSSCL